MESKAPRTGKSQRHSLGRRSRERLRRKRQNGIRAAEKQAGLTGHVFDMAECFRSQRSKNNFL